MAPPRYAVGEVVRRVTAPDQVGQVREVYWSDQTDEWMCRVRFGLRAITLPERALEPLLEAVDPWQDLIDGRTAGPTAFKQLLTFERISRPASRVAASFGTAKAKLLPYQFKPLLKFIESANQRILIADDVGLGKTVEAGYIYKELQARHGVARCLVVVPARLRTKWRLEFKNRFEESFEIVGAKEIRERLIERGRDGTDPERFLWITSYESLRQPSVVEGLTELQPNIDLVILDEAHRIRNAATEQHRAVRALSSGADAMVLLSATPVQTDIENLFQLLSVIDAGTFANREVFRRQINANAPVVRALRLVRKGGDGPLRAAEELETLRANSLTESLTREAFFSSLLERLRSVLPEDRARLVELQRDIAELSVTSQVISRTRKVDVMPNRPERRPQSVRVTLTQEERDFYHEVLAMFDRQDNNWGVSMALLMAMRLTASCMPAAAAYFAEQGVRGISSPDVLADAAVSDDSGDDSGNGASHVPDAKVGAGRWSEPNVDSKFKTFESALEGVWADDARLGRPPRKVIVFAFFRGTLDYLSEQLTKRKLKHCLIHGRIDPEVRETRISEFINNKDVRVLLSSEVGSEGVDLQAASVVVNYDLPWNPMVVEQRIGRIDRIGQQSDVLLIINLVLADTVEDRILLRLYDRLDLFRNSIGEMEDILGQRLDQLAIDHFQNNLTSKELERRVEQEALAYINQRKEAEHLQEEADQLLAGDQGFLDEVQGLVGLRKVPAARELHRFLSDFLDENYPGCQLPDSCLSTTANAHLRPEIAARLLNSFSGDQDAKRVANAVSGGPFPLTFDSDAFLRVGRAEFVSMHHPLIRLACRDFERQTETQHRAFRLNVGRVDGVANGIYAVGVIEMEISGVRPRTELVPLAIKVGQPRLLSTDASWALYRATLDEGGPLEAIADHDTETLADAARTVQKAGDVARAAMLESETTLGALRAARRRATQEGTLRQKLTAARQRAADRRQQGAKEFTVRMAEGQATKAQARLDAFLEDMNPDKPAQIVMRDVAVAFVRVGSRS